MAEVGDQEQRRILVAVDESEESMHALSWCIKNIVSGNSENTLIIIIHAPRPTVFYPSIDDTAFIVSRDVMASLVKHDREVARSVVEKAKKLCQQQSDVKVEGRVEDGDPRYVICEMVNTLKADLLVIGSHGYGLITRTLLGSVSNYCVHNASCPVLVVKMPKSNASGSGSK